MAKPCGSCGETEHCRPNCPELFWPDGTKRGTIREPLPLPPYLGPGAPGIPKSIDSPLNEELAGIFKGSTEKMIERHIREQRERFDADRADADGQPDEALRG